MHEFVSFNHLIGSAKESSLMSISLAALYGKGVFTTIAIYDGKPFLWEKHWRRLEGDAHKLGIDLTEFSEQSAKQSLDKLIRQNNVLNGRGRITFFDGTASEIWPFETTGKASLLIMTGDQRPLSENFKLTVSSHTVNSASPLAGVKSCNYLENLMALDEAKARGFNEAIRVNERGEITSAAMANVFWLKDGVLHTPSLMTGCLAGTMREFVMEQIECREVEATIEQLENAEAIFLTSAGLGLIRAAEFGSKQLEKTGHPILALLPLRR